MLLKGKQAMTSIFYFLVKMMLRQLCVNRSYLASNQNSIHHLGFTLKSPWTLWLNKTKQEKKSMEMELTSKFILLQNFRYSYTENFPQYILSIVLRLQIGMDLVCFFKLGHLLILFLHDFIKAPLYFYRLSSTYDVFRQSICNLRMFQNTY